MSYDINTFFSKIVLMHLNTTPYPYDFFPVNMKQSYDSVRLVCHFKVWNNSLTILFNFFYLGCQPGNLHVEDFLICQFQVLVVIYDELHKILCRYYTGKKGLLACPGGY